MWNSYTSIEGSLDVSILIIRLTSVHEMKYISVKCNSNGIEDGNTVINIQNYFEVAANNMK